MKIGAYVSERQKGRKKRRRYVFGTVIFCAIYLFLVAVAWIIFRSPFFRLDHIVVEGNTVVPQDEIISLLQSSALKDHGF